MDCIVYGWDTVPRLRLVLPELECDDSEQCIKQRSDAPPRPQRVAFGVCGSRTHLG